jgi:hypothetical protein
MTPEQIPPTGGYMVAAYIVAAVILVAYAVMLWSRGSTKGKS